MTFRRALLLAVASGAIAVAGLVAIYASTATLSLPIGASAGASGMYDAETDGPRIFAWTSGHALWRLPGLDRRVPWECTVAFRGARPAQLPEATVAVLVDGVEIASRSAGTDDQRLGFVAPARSQMAGLNLGLIITPTFVPGSSDKRALGVQLEHLSCRANGVAMPPRRALAQATLTAVVLGFAVGCFNLPWIGGFGLLALVSVGNAIALCTGVASFGPFVNLMSSLAAAASIAGLAALGVTRAIARAPLSLGARLAVAVSMIVLDFHILGLSHPSKPLVDAVFHAHRLEWVLDGRWYFSQPIRGTSFPYAIALYVAAAPFASLTHDHVLLLRSVAVSANVLAGTLLAWAAIRVWSDQGVAVVAVALFAAVPMLYTVLGNANLTNMFAASTAIIAMTVASVWSLRPRDVAQSLALVALIAVPLLAHVSTLLIVPLACFSTALAYAVLGEKAWRPTALVLTAATAAALVLAFVLYYRHFPEVYDALRRVTASQASPITTTPQKAPLLSGPSLPVRMIVALGDTLDAFGWPLIALAALGAWRCFAERRRDRLTLALLAWLLTWTVSVAVAVVPRVQTDYQKYTDEFIARVNLVISPLVVFLAALGVAWAWRAAGIWRVAAAAVGVTALGSGMLAWMRWFR